MVTNQIKEVFHRHLREKLMTMCQSCMYQEYHQNSFSSFKQSTSLSPASKDNIYIELTSFSKIRFSESFDTGAYIIFEVALVEHIEEPGRADHDKGGKYDAIEYSLQKNM